VLLIPGLDKDLAGTRTEHENFNFLMSIGMATNSLAQWVAELEISTQAPNSTPNPSEDHEADGLYRAKTGLEPVSIINRIMIDLDMLPESLVARPKSYHLQRKWSWPRRAVSRSVDPLQGSDRYYKWR
jgi:hypothetical protein